MKKIYADLKTTGKYVFIFAVFGLTCQGAVSMTQKQWVQVAMGSQANASEVVTSKTETTTDYIDSKAVTVPQGLEPIKIELTDSEKAGLAKCLKVKAKDYCNDLFN